MGQLAWCEWLEEPLQIDRAVRSAAAAVNKPQPLEQYSHHWRLDPVSTNYELVII